MFNINLKIVKIFAPIIFLVLSAVAISHLSQRPQLPLTVQQGQDRLLLQHSRQLVDTLFQMNSVPIDRIRHLRMLLNQHTAGDSVHLVVQSDSIVSVTLQQQYRHWQLLIKGIAALGILLLATLVLWRTLIKGEKYFAICGFFVAFVISVGGIGTHINPALSIPLVLLYLLLLPQTALLFVYFCYHFPQQQLLPEQLRQRKSMLQYSGFGLAIVLWVLFIAQYFSRSGQSLATFDLTLTILRYVMMTVVAAGLFIIYRNTFAKPNPVNARKFHWMLGGLAISGLPVLLLVIAPQWFGATAMLGAWTYDIFLLVVYAAFAIAILFYRSLDIEKWLSATMVYAVTIIAVMPLIILAMLLLAGITTPSVAALPTYAAIMIGITLAFSFEPLRKLLDPLVNRTFFPLYQKRRSALISAQQTIANAYDEAAVADVLPDLLSETVNPRIQTVFVKDRSQASWQAAAGDLSQAAAEAAEWLDNPQNTIVDTIAIHRESLDRVEEDRDFAVVDLPSKEYLMLFPVGKHLLWAFGHKVSGDIYWREDCEVITEIIALARLRLAEIEQFRQNLGGGTVAPELKDLPEPAVDGPQVSPLEQMLQQLKNGAGNGQSNRLVERLQQLMSVDQTTAPLRIRTAINKSIDHFYRSNNHLEIVIRNTCSKSHRIETNPQVFSAMILTLLEAIEAVAGQRTEISIRSRAFTADRQKFIGLTVSGSDIVLPDDTLDNAEELPGIALSADSGDWPKTILHSVLEMARTIDGELTAYVEQKAIKGFTISLPRT